MRDRSGGPAVLRSLTVATLAGEHVFWFYVALGAATIVLIGLTLSLLLHNPDTCRVCAQRRRSRG